MSRPETINEQGVTEDAEAERGIDLFGIVVAILSEWRLGLTAFAIVSVICIGLVFTLKPQFVATAVLLPQSGRGDGGNIASLFSNRGPGQLYIGLLQSRSVEDDVIQHAGLLQLFGTASLEAARNELSAKSSFAEGGDTLVTISVRDGNAQDAARIRGRAVIHIVVRQDHGDQAGHLRGVTRQPAEEHGFFRRFEIIMPVGNIRQHLARLPELGLELGKKKRLKECGVSHKTVGCSLGQPVSR